MVVLTQLPELAIIAGFKGKVDYYVCRGVPCARKWPRSPGGRRSPEVEAQWPTFAYAATLWSQLSPEVQEAYNSMSSGTGLSGRDLATRAYLSGLYRYPTGP